MLRKLITLLLFPIYLFTMGCIVGGGAEELEATSTSTENSGGSEGSSEPAPVTLVQVGGVYEYSDGTYATTCKAYRDSSVYNSEGNGLYRIDPDGSGGNAEIAAYCDMTRDGGGWTLIANRRGGTSNNSETCGSNLNDFFQNTCGNINGIDYGDSYNIGGATVRDNIRSTGEWLFIQKDSGGTEDTDDAFIIHHSSDIFPSSTGTLNRISITKVCDVNNSNCDSAGAEWLWCGTGYFSGSSCAVGWTDGGYLGNYGYCPNGASGTSNALFGNRTGYAETKLWVHNSGSKDYEEEIYLR